MTVVYYSDIVKLNSTDWYRPIFYVAVVPFSMFFFGLVSSYLTMTEYRGAVG